VHPDLVRQEIRLEPLDRPELFCVWPFYSLGHDERLKFDPHRERLQRPGSLARRAFAYELATTAFVDGRQVDLVPADGRVDLQQLLQFPAEALPRTADLAAQWLSQSGIGTSDPVGRARALEARLRTSPHFAYRLGGYQRTSDLDPIEDFVVNDPRGHCEYFASALTLMLRSGGLPARMVVGYKTDEYNYLEQCFWARQSDAHTWVEAYIPPDAIPDEAKQRDSLSDWSHGGWLRLDPTPSDLGELSWGEYLKETLRSYQARIQTAWTQHVVQMSGSRQDLLIYRPLVQGTREALARMSRGHWWGARHAGVTDAIGSPWQLFPPPLLIASGLVLCGLVISLVTRRRRGAMRNRLAAGAAPGFGQAGGCRTIEAEFYRRWEAVVRRWGLEREPAQTHREFARQAGARLAESAGQPQLRDAALCVADAFYQIRFGGDLLDDQQSVVVDDALSQLRLATRTSQG
jgi:protein-glutamine gamma-glutamyltransferase